MTERAAVAPTLAKPAARQAPQQAVNKGKQLETWCGLEQCSGDISANDLSRIRNAPHILDGEQARLLLTHTLLQHLAPRLGLSLAEIRIEVNPQARQKLDSVQAKGMVENGTIFLHPQVYRPEQAAGRYLLTHELLHLAQQSLPALQGVDPLARAAAEQEAHTLANDYAYQNLAPNRVQAWLPRTGAAHNTDYDFSAEYGAVIQSLKPKVVLARERELALIKNYLSGWWVSDGDVFKILALLDSMPFAAAAALIATLGEENGHAFKKLLADNLNPPHLYKNRRSVLACFAGLLDSGPQYIRMIDVDCFRALNDGGMSAEEAESAHAALMALEDSTRQRLLTTENGRVIARLLRLPLLTEKEARQVVERAKAALGAESQLAEKQQEIAQARTDPHTGELVEMIKQAFTPHSGEHADLQSDVQRALSGIDLLGEYPEATIKAVAEKLDTEGWLNTIFEAIPVDKFFSPEKRGETLVKLCSARLPAKNQEFIESLLSYGLLDWAVRDNEAMLAWRILKTMPLSEQYQFRLKEGGKWYYRLLDNLPKDQVPQPGLEIRRAGSREELDKLSATYQRFAPTKAAASDKLATEISADQEFFYNASQLYERRLQHSDASDALLDLKEKFRTAQSKAKLSDEEVIWLYTELSRVGWGEVTAETATATDFLLREAVIRELDNLGYVQFVFERLSDNFLYAEDNRLRTVQIMMARDPGRAMAHARELVARAFFSHWVVTDRQAYLAYLCIKALPQDERNQFVAQNPELWDRIQSEMPPSQRQALDNNLYVGDREGKDRSHVLYQLSQSDTWQEKNASLLDGLLLIAYAMGEKRFAFERSREFCAQLPATELESETRLAQIIEKYRLWKRGNPARQQYQEEKVQARAWYEDGPVQVLKAAGNLIVALYDSRFLIVDGKPGLSTNMKAAQNLLAAYGGSEGGLLDGAQFADEGKDGSNRVYAFKRSKGYQVSLPQLVIERVNLQNKDSTFQCGKVTLHNLRIDQSFDDEDLSQPLQASLDFASLEVSDILMSKSESITACTQLQLQQLHISAGANDHFSGAQSPPKVSQSGGVLVNFPLLPLLPLLALAGAGYLLISKLISSVRIAKDNGVDTSKAGGMAEDFRELTKSINFSLAALNVHGVTTSGGQHVEAVEIRQLQVGTGMTKAANLLAKKQSLQARLNQLEDKPKAAAERDLLKQELEKADKAWQKENAKTARYQQLRRLIASGKLSPAQLSDVQAELDKYDFDSKSESYVDIASLEVRGVRGSITSKEPLHINGIHGEGGGNALLGLLGTGKVETPAHTSQQAQQRPPAIVDDKQAAAFELQLRDVSTGKIEVAGGVWSSEELQRKIKELEDSKEADKEEIDKLQALQFAAVQYEHMMQTGVSRLSPTQLARFKQYRAQLQRQPALILAKVEAKNARLALNLGAGQIGFRADSFDIDGIEVPERGLAIRRLHAEQFALDASVGGSLLRFLEWRKYLQNGQLSAKTISLEDIDDQKSGFAVKRVAFNRLQAGVDFDPGQKGVRNARVTLQAGAKEEGKDVAGVEIDGANLRLTAAILLRQLGQAERVDPTKLSPAQKRKFEQHKKELIQQLKLLEKLNQALAQDQALQAKTPGERQRQEKRIARDKAALEEWQKSVAVRRLTVSGLNLEISDLGDVLDEKYKLMEHGFNLQGGGKNSRIFDDLAIYGVGLGGAKAGTFGLGEAHFGPLEAKAQVKKDHISMQGKLPHVTLRRLHLGSEVYDLDVKDGGVVELFDTQLQIEISLNPEADARTGEGSLKRIEIRRLDIPVATVNQLQFRLHDAKDGDIVIKIHEKPATLKGIKITPANGFSLAPEQGWAVKGAFGFQTFEAPGLEAKLPGIFDGTADLSGGGFFMDFIDTDKKRIWLGDLKASDIKGKLLGDKFEMLRENIPPGAEANLHLQGLNIFKNGDETSISFEALAAHGFHYDNKDLGLHLAIASASLLGQELAPGLNAEPAFSLVKRGNTTFIKLKKLRLQKAGFTLDDLLKLGKKDGKEKKKEKSGALNPRFFNFLDHLNGGIMLTAHLSADLLGHNITDNRATTRDFPIMISINQGRINFANLESSVFKNSTLFQTAVDFELDEKGRLYLQIDLKQIGAALGIALGVGVGIKTKNPLAGAVVGGLGATGLAIGGHYAGKAATNKADIGWDLQPMYNNVPEQHLARTKNEVRLQALLRDAFKEKPASPPPAPGEKPAFSVYDIAVDVDGITLNLDGGISLNLADLGVAGLGGTINLGAPTVNAVEDLTISGHIYTPAQEKASKGKKQSRFALGVGGVNCSVTDLEYTGAATARKDEPGVSDATSIRINTGPIHLGKLADASLTFGTGDSSAGASAINKENIFPKKLTGTVTDGSADDVEIDITKFQLIQLQPAVNKLTKKGKKK